MIDQSNSNETPRLFTQLDIQLIKASLASRTDEEIADILQKPVDLVKAKIDEITGMGEVRQQLVQAAQAEERERKEAEARERRANRKKTRAWGIAKEGEKEAKELMRQKREQAVINRDHAAQLQRQKHQNQRQYKTRVIDFSQLRSMKIDSKTTVFLEPGDDEYDVRERYLKLRKNQTNGTHGLEDQGLHDH